MAHIPPPPAADPAIALEENLLLQALQVAQACGHHTLTFRAALRVAAYAAQKVEHRPLSGPEAPAALDRLADLLRDMIRAEPDLASSNVEELGMLIAARDDAANPRFWFPTVSQRARAAQELGVEPREVHDTAFTEDGALYARALGGDFVEIPLGQVNPAEEREDA